MGKELEEIILGVMKKRETETANNYKQLVEEPTEQGFVIQGVTIDGKRGVAKAFGDIPVQMCHFHQAAIIKRYLTSRPKLEASIESLHDDLLILDG